jgi:hypothetical protein
VVETILKSIASLLRSKDSSIQHVAVKIPLSQSSLPGSVSKLILAIFKSDTPRLLLQEILEHQDIYTQLSRGNIINLYQAT